MYSGFAVAICSVIQACMPMLFCVCNVETASTAMGN